jgi:hypothetical protein
MQETAGTLTPTAAATTLRTTRQELRTGISKRATEERVKPPQRNGRAELSTECHGVNFSEFCLSLIQVQL